MSGSQPFKIWASFLKTLGAPSSNVSPAQPPSLSLGGDADTIIHENFTDETIDELGSAFTVRTITEMDIELEFARNFTEEEARGSVATLEPIDFTATPSEVDEAFTAVPDLFATGFPEEVENRTEVGLWEGIENATISISDALFTTDTPEVSSVEDSLWSTGTPELESAPPFTVEERIIVGTAAPDIGFVPRGPISPTGMTVIPIRSLSR